VRSAEARLVVEDVVAQAAVALRAPACHQVLHPGLLYERARRTFGSRGIVADYVLAAVVRTPLPASGIHCQSLPVCGPYSPNRKLASLLRFDPTFATQSNQRDRQHAACAFAAARRDERVRRVSPAWRSARRCSTKYQSLRGCRAFTCQLYRVVLLPPLR